MEETSHTGRGFAISVVTSAILQLIVPTKERSQGTTNKVTRRTRTRREEKHIGQEWQSDSDSDDDDDNEKRSMAAIVVQERSSSTKIFTNNPSSTSLISDTHSLPRLFTNLSDDDDDSPTCLMAKGDKV